MSQVIMILLGTLSLLSEATWLHNLAVYSMIPNITLILVVLWGMLQGSVRGRILGITLGLLQDFLFCRYVGFYGLVYYLLGHAGGYFHKDFFRSHAILPLAIVAGADLVYGFLQYLVYYFFSGNLEIGYYFLHHILPETCYTAMVSVICYPLLHLLSKKLQKLDRHLKRGKALKE